MLFKNFKIQHASHIKPTQITATPIINNHPVIGSNKTNNIPNPNPTKQTANVFLKNLFNLFPPIL